MASKLIQAKNITDEEIFGVVDKVRKEENIWTNRWQLEESLPQYPPKVILAKCASMIRRGILDGCTCGCRGDFERPHDLQG